MPTCPCGNTFEQRSALGRPRRWCYECRPERVKADDEEPQEEQRIEQMYARVREDGRVEDLEGNVLNATIGFPVGAVVTLQRFDEEQFEIVAMPQLPPDVHRHSADTRWLSVMERQRASLETRLDNWWEKLADSEGDMRVQLKVRKVEEEARAYNALAEEMGLPLLGRLVT